MAPPTLPGARLLNNHKWRWASQAPAPFLCGGRGTVPARLLHLAGPLHAPLQISLSEGLGVFTLFLFY